MRVVVITQDETLYIPYFFQRFLELIHGRTDINILKIYLVPSFGESLLENAARGFQFYGLAGFLKQGTRTYLNKMLSFLGLRRASVRSLGAAYEVPVIDVDDVNEDGFVATLQQLKPDIVLSVAAPQIFKKKLLDVPAWGCINIHSARLPKYRGMMPNFWAMYHGDETAGITVHTMDEKLDQGKIVLQDEIEIHNDDTLDTLVKRSKQYGAEMVVKALEAIETGDVELKDYEGESSFFSFPTRRDIQAFKSRGKKLL